MLPSINPGSIAFELYTRISNFNFETIFILSAIDHEGAHLHVVDDCLDISHTETAYTAIGSGGVLASVSIARRGHQKTCGLAETVYKVYEAKKTAELAKCVGNTTDLSIMRQGQTPVNVGADVIAILRATYDRLAPPSLSESDIQSIAAAVTKPPEG